jgi:hypothetical protein
MPRRGYAASFDTVLIGHAFGARYDLPVPLWMFLVGSGLVVLLSFALVARQQVRAATLPGVDGFVVRRAGLGRGVIGVLVAVLLAITGVYGSQAVAENILPTAFWLIGWIAIPISCGVFGDWTTSWNPFAVVARAADRDGLRQALIAGPETLPWPKWLAWWPAVGLYFVVSAGELIYNGTATAPLVTGVSIGIYGLVSAGGGLLFGSEAWLARGEMFSVLFATWGRIGWWRFGRPGRKGFLGGIDQPFETTPSRITFVLLMLMSVTFDGLLSTPQWRDLKRLLPATWQPGSGGYVLVGVGAFMALVALAWLVFSGCAVAVRAAGGGDRSVIATLADLLPSLLPIAFGYLVAHNLDYLAINGQLLIPLSGNPTGKAQWLPHPFDDSYVVNKNIVPSSFIWYFQVVLIIAVHIAAVVIAHRHLARTAPSRAAAQRAELPWLFAMVAYTMTSLWLLAQPIVEEHPASSPARTHPAASASYPESPGRSPPSSW